MAGSSTTTSTSGTRRRKTNHNGNDDQWFSCFPVFCLHPQIGESFYRFFLYLNLLPCNFPKAPKNRPSQTSAHPPPTRFQDCFEPAHANANVPQFCPMDIRLGRRGIASLFGGSGMESAFESTHKPPSNTNETDGLGPLSLLKGWSAYFDGRFVSPPPRGKNKKILTLFHRVISPSWLP